MPTRILLLLMSILLVGFGSAAQATGASWHWPVADHQVLRAFDPPATEYGAGHRGVDLAGTFGSAVRAVAPGTVAFAGDVAGVGVLVIDHGLEESTYQPVEPVVELGDAVASGEVIGTLESGHGHRTSLHLGRKRGDTYLDPLELLGRPGRFRLVSPDGPPPVPPSSATLRLPVGGPITSAFGMRVHPISGERKLHDGLDFGAACGTTVRAAATGIVTSVGTAGAYGLRVEIEHDGGLGTSYSHLTASQVRIGARVHVAEPIGMVGSTGSSTGCHLHFSVHQDGRAIDPSRYL